jgi:hypothetical protein
MLISMRIIWWLVALQNPSHSKHINGLACFIFIDCIYMKGATASILIWTRFIYIDTLVRNPYKGKRNYTSKSVRSESSEVVRRRQEGSGKLLIQIIGMRGGWRLVSGTKMDSIREYCKAETELLVVSCVANPSPTAQMKTKNSRI